MTAAIVGGIDTEQNRNCCMVCYRSCPIVALYRWLVMNAVLLIALMFIPLLFPDPWFIVGSFT